ncbi:MAG TPA: hypothetical protein VFM48_16225 [Aquabacterium sp.]|nr:hypothetical protein [Aquabacterium sp.]
MKFFKHLERLSASVAQVVWWVAIAGGVSTAFVGTMWWRGGHERLALGALILGAACVLPSTMLAEALADMARMRRTVTDGYQRLTREDSSTVRRARDGLFSAVSISWLMGSAALLSNPFFWLLALAAMLGCVGLSFWAVGWMMSLWW